MKSKIFLLTLLLSCTITPKVLIFTYAHNRPDFIEIQHKTFEKFLQDDYEFVVWNDANNNNMSKNIENMCKKYNIRCIRIPQEIHDRPYLSRMSYRPSQPVSKAFSRYHSRNVRNSNVVQYSFDTLGVKHDDILALFDSDIFLTEPFSICEYLKGYDLASSKIYCYQNVRHTCADTHPGIDPFYYLWIGLIFLDMSKLPNTKTINFNCGEAYGKSLLDAGGWTCYYLHNNPNIRIKEITRSSLEPYNWLKPLICSQCIKHKKPAPACTHNTKKLKQLNFSKNTIDFIQSMPLLGLRVSTEFLLHGTFLHYRAGSLISSSEFSDQHKIKTKIINDFIKKIVS